MYLLADQYLKDSLEADALSLHYTFANPEQYGLECSGGSITPYSKERFLNGCKDALAFDRELKELDKESFDEEAVFFYSKLTRMSDNNLAFAKYLYYEEPLNPVTGIQSQLPILLAEYTFRDLQDVKNYLTLLSSLPAYFDGIVRFEQEKSAMGLFMSDRACNDLILQLDQIMQEDKIASGNHFLQSTFEDRLDTLIQAKELTTEEADPLTKTNHRLIKEAILPAYQKLADELEKLKGTGNPDAGLAALPDGREYYSLLVAKNTGSSKTIPQLKELLVRDYISNYEKLRELCRKDPTPSLLSITSSPDIANDFVDVLSLRTSRDFPCPADTTGIRVSLKQVGEDLSPYVSPAFYLTPPCDSYENNVIYLNLGKQPNEISLFTTLAHEGYPGHLYETVYHRVQDGLDDNGYLENLFYYGGYTEGWATYVEMRSYEYLASLNPSGADRDNYLFTVEFCRLQSLLQLNTCCLLDLAIHDGGITMEDTKETLARIGITDNNAAENVYQYIVSSPANYLTYYIGYLEILECRALTAKLMGDDYTDLQFHTYMLSHGPNDFDSIKYRIRNDFPAEACE